MREDLIKEIKTSIRNENKPKFEKLEKDIVDIKFRLNKLQTATDQSKLTEESIQKDVTELNHRIEDLETDQQGGNMTLSQFKKPKASKPEAPKRSGSMMEIHQPQIGASPNQRIKSRQIIVDDSRVDTLTDYTMPQIKSYRPVNSKMDKYGNITNVKNIILHKDVRMNDMNYYRLFPMIQQPSIDFEQLDI